MPRAVPCASSLSVILLRQLQWRDDPGGCEMLRIMPAMISTVLEALEGFYGQQEPPWPSSPYLYMVWLHCGYPASDDRCSKGWESLRRTIGLEPGQILAASLPQLTKALSPGGMVPGTRARRLKEVATIVIDEC